MSHGINWLLGTTAVEHIDPSAEWRCRIAFVPRDKHVSNTETQLMTPTEPRPEEGRDDSVIIDGIDHNDRSEPDDGNVTTFNTAALIFPQESTLYFPIVIRSMYWRHRDGQMVAVDDHKIILRRDEHTSKPVQLSIVGKSYRIVHNRELFPAIEQRLVELVEPQYLRDVKVHDEMSYNGRNCYRHYCFPNMQVQFGTSDIAFRIIVGNSYGEKGVELIGGAIDAWCSNGMLIGRAERKVRKHTSGIEVVHLTRWIEDIIRKFWLNAKEWEEWSRVSVADVDALFAILVKRGLMSERLATWMAGEYRTNNVGAHGETLWAFYSTLTAWATHMPFTRDTGQDHKATTRIDRGIRVAQMMRVITDTMSSTGKAA